MRGTLLPDLIHWRYSGIIPAYAGNTCTSSRHRPIPRDHPRVCGEHLPFRKRCSIPPGSSPRMRGTPACSRRTLSTTGIIPAYAGNTHDPFGLFAQHRDHPRVCGEHYFIITADGFQVGSSPRMRGTQKGISNVQCSTGIIPAYAGNTLASAREDGQLRDHPRVCGEHCDGSSTQIGLRGSSPRMRGTRQTGLLVCRSRGIIPAYAGNTPRRRNTSGSTRDHPRVCGEHCCPLPVNLTLPGSSPRMRGTLERRFSTGSNMGIIPAYAGNTEIGHCHKVFR